MLRALLHWNPALPAGAASGSAPNWGVRGTSHWMSPAQGLEGRALLAGRGRDKGGGLTSQKLLGNVQEGIFSKVWAIILKKAPGPVYEVQAPVLSRGVGSLSPLCPTPHVSLAKVTRFPVCLHVSHALERGRCWSSQVLDQVPERNIVVTQVHSGCTPHLGVLE